MPTETASADFKALQSEIEALGDRVKSLVNDGTKAGETEADKIAALRERRKSELVRANRSEGSYPLWKAIDFDEIDYSWNREHVAGQTHKMLEGIKAGLEPGLRRAVDSVAVGPLIRQDLDPMIYEVYVKQFPAWDTIEKVESNGLVHAWNQEIAYSALDTAGTSTFISELGTVTDDAATYERLTANIAVNASRRGISLKAKYAVRAGGMNYDPAQREIAGGLRNIAHSCQKGIFRLQDAISGSTTATDPNGMYDANAFNGLRYYLQNVSPAGNTIGPIDESGSIPSGTPLADAIDQACVAVQDAGGQPTMIWTGLTVRRLIRREQEQFVRNIKNSMEQLEVIPGVMVPAIVAGDNLMPIMGIPGDSVGTYTISGHSYADIYVFDSEEVQWAWLGGPGPTVLTIPTGTDGTLRELYIPFMMGGFVPVVPQFLARVSVKLS
jgi:hypothetical protein